MIELEYINREGNLDPDFIRERRLRTIKHLAANRVEALQTRLNRAKRVITANTRRTFLLAYTDLTEGTSLVHEYAEQARQRRITEVAHKYGLHA